MSEHHRDHQAPPVPLEAFKHWMAAMYDQAWADPDPVERAAALAEMEHPATRRLLFAAFMAGASAARRPARLQALHEAAEAANTAAFQGMAVLAVFDLLEAEAAGTEPMTNGEDSTCQPTT